MSHDEEAFKLDGESDTEFEARRENLHPRGDHGGGGEHGGGAEMGWLVSYADMMTLLTGLFVLLFSLAKQGDGTLEHTMKKVSSEYFNPAQVEAQVTPVATPFPMTEVRPELKPETTETTPDVVSEIVSETPVETVSQSTPAPTAVVESVTEATPIPAENLSPKVESLEAEVAKAKTQLERSRAKIASLEKQIQDTNADSKQIIDQQKEIEALKEQIQNTPKPVDQRYVAMIVAWETEKHDIDLYVTAPSGKTFNFKKREFKSTPGRFEIDSRYGPGIEMWKAEKFEPGIYKIRYSLYSQNGNTAPAKIRFSIVTNSQTFKSDPIELSETGADKTMNVKIDEKGKLEMLP